MCPTNVTVQSHKKIEKIFLTKALVLNTSNLVIEYVLTQNFTKFEAVHVVL